MVEPKFDGWFKSSKSSGNDHCVEVARTDDGTVGVRDSKDHLGPILQFSPDAWETFTDGVRNGDFDV